MTGRAAPPWSSRGGWAVAMALVACGLQASGVPEPAEAMARMAKLREVPMTDQLDSALQAMVDTARADLRKRLERESPAAGDAGDAGDIELLRAERVTWRTSALGCPQPDRAYLMVLTPGVRIVLRAGGASFEYHATPNGTPFLCEPPATIETPAPAGSSLDPT